MKKRRGRPSIDGAGPSTHVGVTLSAAQYDAYCQQALRDGVSVPEVIRRELQTGRIKIQKT